MSFGFPVVIYVIVVDLRMFGMLKHSCVKRPLRRSEFKLRLGGCMSQAMDKAIEASNKLVAHRKAHLKYRKRYGRNLAGKWVRCCCFRDIDYLADDPHQFREFDTFDAAFEFEETLRLVGSGGRSAKSYSKLESEYVPSRRG